MNNQQLAILIGNYVRLLNAELYEVAASMSDLDIERDDFEYPFVLHRIREIIEAMAKDADLLMTYSVHIPPMRQSFGTER